MKNEVKEIGKLGNIQFEIGDIIKVIDDEEEYYIGKFQGFEKTLWLFRSRMVIRACSKKDMDSPLMRVYLENIEEITVLKNAR